MNPPPAFADVRPRLLRRTLLLLAPILSAAFAPLFLIPVQAATAPDPLASLQYRVVGAQLRAFPESVTVPRNVAGSIQVAFAAGDIPVEGSLGEAGAGTRVEATLRGPSFPAQRLTAEYGDPLFLPPLRLTGDYQLDDIQLVRGTNILLQATPSNIPVRVFDEVLVSRVTSRPLSLEEIHDKGIALDQSNFRVVEFDVTLVLRGRSFRVVMPVAAPTARLSTEIIPAAELEDRTVELDRLNRELAESVQLPPEFAAEMPDFRINPINFQRVGEDAESEKKGIPITGLLVIPGNIGFLNQFFSIQLFTENAAPSDSRLSVNNVRALLRLPPGADGLPARSHDQPGDDPLRMARIGPDRIVLTNLPVVLPGSDQQWGTPDDITRLQPGETGSAEFLVEGLKEGLHVLDIDLEADLEGLAAGITRIRGRASGSVLVRNANFSMTFAHPRTVRTGEPYEASVTLLNTGDFEANLVSVSLNRLAVSGTVLLSDERVELGNLAPGESATATFRFRSQRTGSVYFSNLTTSDDSVRGRLSLFMGVDERGVPLSPDSIGYPDWVAALPPELFTAANRVLGQALSIATAARLPDGVRKLSSREVEQRVIELAEAGQRLRYGDDPRRVLVDLALDWQGGREFDPGFDQLLRVTDAGREWREAVASLQEGLDAANTPQRLATLAPSLAGLGQAWWIATSGSPELVLSAHAIPPDTDPATAPSTSATHSDLPQSLAYAGIRGAWLASRPDTNLTYTWRASTSLPAVEVSFLEIGADGLGEQLAWSLPPLAAGNSLTFKPGDDSQLLLVQGEATTTLAPIRTAVREDPPAIVSVRQDISVVSDRVFLRCPIREYGNWGTVLAVLFSKPMAGPDVEESGAYRFADGNGARTARLQNGGRVCLLQLHRGIGSFAARPREYTLAIDSLPDPRGNRSTPGDHRVLTTPAKGASLRGRVYGVDGNPVARVPVTLTMEDRIGNKCLPAEFRAGQVFTDDNGYFTLDFVLADVPFNLAAIDTSRMTDDDARTLLGVLLEAVGPRGADRPRIEELARDPDARDAMLRAFNLGEIGQAIAAAEGLDRAVHRDMIPQGGVRDGGELAVALRFRGRGSVTGRVLASSGAPLPGAAVNLFPDPDSRELGRGQFTDADGSFAFHGVPLGEFSLNAETLDGRCRIVASRLLATGEVQDVEVVVPDQAERFAAIRGFVLEADGTRHPSATVHVAREVRGNSATGLVASTVADPDGYFRFPRIPAGTWTVVAISADGRRRGVRPDLRLADGGEPNVLVALDATATVRGIVRYWDGTPAPRAKVGGGDRVVRTDDHGRFELSGVPLGTRSILAGIDGSDARDGVTRIGSTELHVAPVGNDEVTVRLNALGRIRGVVFDGSGTNRVPNVRVAIPVTGGFYWVDANRNGEYEFNGFGLGSYLVSAPSPPVSKSPDELAAEALEALGSARSGGGTDEAAALVGELANLYAQGSLGRLVTTDYTPGSWGFNNATLEFDGQTVVANINYLPGASLRGIVVNHQEVPIGAEVTVRAFGPNKYGAPSIKEIGPFASAPDSGAWSASGFLVGPYSVTARSPLLVGNAHVEGLLTSEAPHLTNLVVRFPPQADVTGRLLGTVLNPDGSPVTRAEVAISFAADYVIQTDTNGLFDTQIRLPAAIYTLTATNLDNALIGRSQIRLVGGITNFAVVPLLGKGDLTVRVVDPSGSPAPGSQVRLTRFAFPADDSAELTTDQDGVARFEALWEGDWQISVERLAGVTKTQTRAGSRVEIGVTHEVTVVLGPVASLTGLFVEESTGRPIPGAQVFATLRRIDAPPHATAPTLGDGSFELAGLPLDTYFLVARNPVSGRLGTAEVQLATDGEVRRVTLVERSLGEIHGIVLSGDGTRGLSGVAVRYSGPDPLSPARSVTTDPSGAFQFPSIPIGPFRLVAKEPSLGLTGSATGELTPGNSPLRVDFPVQGLGFAEITVLEPDGVTAATNATVTLRTSPPFTSDTDDSGRANFPEIHLGRFQVFAASNRNGERNSVALGELNLTRPGQSQQVILRLSGVARLNGSVVDASGRPVANAAVGFEADFGRTGAERRRTLTDANGLFALNDLPLGPWRIQATHDALAAFDGGEFTEAGESRQADLRLGPSGSVTGTVLRENGIELHEVEVAVFFASQNGQPGFARAITDFAGTFVANGIPVGVPFRIQIDLPSLDGRFALTTNLTTHGQILDVGNLRLDQTPPAITSIQPADGAIEVEPSPRIVVDFSESLLPGSLRSDGIRLSQGTNATAIRFHATNGPAGPDSRLIIAPESNLRSARGYTLLVAGADQIDAAGRPILIGPTDRQGRPLPGTVTSRFTVRDFEPPVVVNEFPTNNATGVEPEVAIRWELDEPIQTNRLQVIVRGPGGSLPGTTGVNASQRILAWVPERRLNPDTTYEVEIRGLVDFSNNEAPPRTNRFSTLDTQGPRIAQLRLAPGQRPVANATVTLEAILDPPEPGAVVRFIRNGSDLGIATEGPVFRWPVRLPAQGTVRISALALDIAGNPGEAAVLELAVGPNQRPIVTLARIEPPFGPLETGRRFSFSANPSDDASLAALRITALGALELTREIFSPSNGVPTPLVFELPPDFVANGDIEFRVVALDDSGATSETAILRYATTDATPPTLELEAPIDGSVLDPRQPLGFGLHVRDNSPFVAATILLSGSVTSTNRLELDLQPNVVLHAPLNLSLSNGLAGGKIECLVRIEDRAGNQVELHRAYTLRGVVGPRLRNIFAVDLGSGWILPGPERLSPWVSSVTFTFDRALAVHPAQTNLLQVTNSLGADIPVIRRVSANGASVEWNAAPLPPGATVSIRLLPGLVDANGNAIQLSDGSDFPASGLESTFRVASFGGLDVTNGRPVVPGQTFLAHIDHETPFPPWNLRLNDVAQPRVVLTATNRFQVTIPTNASIARLSAWSSAPGRPAIELRDVELALRSRDDDDDRDGLPNGWEADRSWVQGAPRFNPFDDTDAAADWDFDQLDNRGEFERGTDPFIADSDGDGLRDGLESHPGSCPDPLKFDSDGDGIRDGDDLAPCAAGEALTLNPQVVSVPEGGHETNLITVTGIGLTPVAIDFSRELPRPSFVEFADFGIRGTNPVTRQVVFRPSFTDAGEHRLVFAITGRRASTVVTTNLELRLIVEDRDNTRFTRWARAASGNWSQPTNWTAGVPGVGTNAVIDLPGSYTVSLDTEAFVESLELGAASGTQTLQLTSRALTLNSASVVRSNAVVRLAGSSRLRGQAEITADGLIAVENGTLEGAGLLRIARDGHLEFGSATTPSFPLLSLPIENSGVVRISPRATLGLSGIQATNRPQGLWHLDDGAMRWNTGSPRFVNEGAWIKTGTNVSTVYFIDIEQRGLLRADDGGIAIESSPVHFAAGGTNSGTGMLRLSSTRGDIAGPLDFARGIVLINSTLTNHATQAWPDLTMTGGVLAGAGEISVSRSWSAQGGSLLGDGRFRIAESAEGMISSSLVIGRPFELAGRARLQTNTLVYVDHHEIQNLGTLEIPDAASLRWFTAFGAGTIENRGTLLKAGTGSLGFAGVSLRNLGRIDVQGGVLDIDYSSENHGRIDVASGTRVDIGAGMIHGGTSWIGGDGQVIFSFGTNDVRGELQPRGGFTVGGGQITIRNSFDRPVNVTLTGGRLSLESPQEFRALHVGNGELTGSGGGVLVNEAFEWTAGTLASAAPIVLNTNSQSRIRGGTLSARLENLGRIEVAPNASVRFLGGDLINRGELELVGLTTFSSQSGTSNRLVNEGLFRTGTNDVNFFGVPLELRGTNVLSAVTLQFGTGTNESRLSIPAGGRLRFQDGFTHTPESRLEGDGAIEFNNGRHEILGGFAPRGDLLFAAGTIRIAPSFTHPARFTLRNATVSLQGDAALREVSLESGRIEVATRLTASRSFTWTGGTLDGSGTVRTDPTTSVRIQGFNDKRLGATFEAEGDVAFAENSRLLLTGGTWRIPAEATHDVLGASQIWPASGIPNSRVQILGTLRKAGPGTLDIDASLDLQGSLLIESGQVDLGGNSRLAGLTRLDPATELRLGGTTNLWSANVRFEGTGALSFYGSRSVLVLETPADLGSLAVTFQNGTQIQGEFPLRSGTAGSLMFQSGTFEIQGAVDVQGRMTVALGSIVRIDDALNLAASGTLDNLGRRDGQNRANIRTRAFQNFGGTVLGVPPDVVPGPSPLGIRPSPGSTPPSQPRLTATPSTTEEGPPTAWILTWDPGDAGFDAIEFSDDLATWQRLEIDPATRARGSLVIPASASRSGPGTLFFRHRNTEW